MNLTLDKFNVFTAAALSAMAISATGGISFAANPGYCAQYARLALHETQANMATPGCFKGFDNRWHLDFQRHYSWCLTADVAAVNAERDYRRMRVYQCQGH